MPHLTYALITPAKNEAEFIEQTILSVVAQEYRPLKWVIVDDGSSDGTAEIVARFARRHDFIVLLKRNGSNKRSFVSKVQAFNTGLSALEDTQCELIGNLDADVVLRPDYYANMIAAFASDQQLGIVGGTVFCKTGSEYETNDTTIDSVAGAVQLFRRECFEQIGGYILPQCGGIDAGVEDASAEIVARMHGWGVRKISDNPVYEERRTGSTQHGRFVGRYKEGIAFHCLGYSTRFFLLRCLYRFKERPACLGSLLSLLGYLSAKIRRLPICLTPEATHYLRSEQSQKIRAILTLKKTPSLLCVNRRIAHKKGTNA
jgi:glycosyltransferase involved in cell wall biosynthesis